jgi:phenylalanyl-tRNA synthetase alpha chain
VEPREAVSQLSLQERKVLLALRGKGRSTPEDLMATGYFRELVEAMNGASWLNAKGFAVIKERLRRSYSLGERGRKPLPERVALRALASLEGVARLRALQEASGLDPDDFSAAVGWLRRKGWAEMTRDPAGPLITITEAGHQAADQPSRDEELLKRLSEADLPEEEVDPQVVARLKGRQGFVRERQGVQREISLTPEGQELLASLLERLGQDYGVVIGGPEEGRQIREALQRMEREEVGELTPELLQSGRWRTVGYRRYDVKSFAPAAHGGKRHPMTWYVERVRRVFTEMGFTEIRGNYVEPAFWAFDALFQPQDHPARDALDTFFVEGTLEEELPDPDVVRRVAEAHESGGETGSEGWRYRWDRQEAVKAILRPHTTGLTIRYLQEHPDPPRKAFSIGRVFRRDAIDWKHLPQFTQIEGVVMEEGANLSMLIGVLKEFYRKMGFEVRVRPGYFPYTEPSLEPEIWFNGQWFELGGSGIFRPEVTRPLGIEAPVLAWGLGLERLVMAVEGISDMRQLIWNDLEWLRNIRVVR